MVRTCTVALHGLYEEYQGLFAAVCRPNALKYIENLSCCSFTSAQASIAGCDNRMGIHPNHPFEMQIF